MVRYLKDFLMLIFSRIRTPFGDEMECSKLPEALDYTISNFILSSSTVPNVGGRVPFWVAAVIVWSATAWDCSIGFKAQCNGNFCELSFETWGTFQV